MANSITHAQLPPVYGALYTLYIGYRKSDGTSLAPTTPDTEVSLDGGTLADTTNEVTLIKEVGGATDSALGYITLTAAEMTADQVTVQSKSDNCVTALLTLRPARIVATRTGTAQAGASGSITLDTAASAVDDYYNGMVLRTDGGTGAGQARVVTDYNGTSKLATVLPAWETTPSTDTTYTVGYLVGPAANQSNVGSVASVTGSVGGSVASVTGAVGSVGTGGITALSIADDAIDAATLADDMNTYQAKVDVIDDDGAGTPADRYVVAWYLNSQPVTAGITVPKLQVIKVADGADLVAEAAMTQIGALGMYRYDETTNRIADGAAYIAKATATIGAATRTWYQIIGRDSASA
jgi:hypothetical protein